MFNYFSLVISNYFILVSLSITCTYVHHTHSWMHNYTTTVHSVETNNRKCVIDTYIHVQLSVLQWPFVHVYNYNYMHHLHTCTGVCVICTCIIIQCTCQSYCGVCVIKHMLLEKCDIHTYMYTYGVVYTYGGSVCLPVVLEYVCWSRFHKRCSHDTAQDYPIKQLENTSNVFQECV